MNYSLENLRVWQNSRELTKEIYQITSLFPQDEKFGLTSQLMDASHLVSFNVAEGSTSWTKKSQSKYYGMAFDGLIAIVNHFTLATYLKFLQENQLTSLREKIDRTGRILKALSKDTPTSNQI
jgi:four helix bundle protein